ncbi:MAG: hypothetical protein EXS37_14455, partial [Opitutus sp.]|nr:hypothetical protein [Opitutus sp.]
MRAVRAFGGGIALVGCALLHAATAPTPVSVQTAPGRFEISAIDATMAHVVAAASEEAWRLLAGPLALPEAFSSPIFVRLVPASDGEEAGRFRVLVEPGGVVSLRMTGDTRVSSGTRRALVQALLLRLGVARYGASEQLNAPLWLEHACVGWWQTRLDGAQLDALKHESRRGSPPSLEALLNWSGGTEEPRLFSVGAVWLLTFLQAESGRAREWPAFLLRLLGGEEPLAALTACYPGRFSDATERELWWQTGYHHARRVRSLPMLEAADSQAQLGALARFVFAGATDETDAVVPLRGVMARADAPIVAADLTRRLADLERLIPALHSFYRNAGLSLAEVIRTGVKFPARREALCATFEQDWSDAIELEAATSAALDELEP